MERFRWELFVFSPGGSLHPIAFIGKLEIVFDDADMPERKQVNLAINVLRGSDERKLRLHGFSKEKLRFFCWFCCFG